MAAGDRVAAGDRLRRTRLARRLHFAALRLVRRLRREVTVEGITAARLSVVSTLVHRGPMTLTDLAEAERVSQPALTRTVQALEREELVIRRRSRDDARVSVVSATSRAWRILEDASEQRSTILRSALEALGPEDLRTLEAAVDLIERLARES